MSLLAAVVAGVVVVFVFVVVVFVFVVEFQKITGTMKERVE